MVTRRSFESMEKVLARYMTDVASEIRICDLKSIVNMIEMDDVAGISEIVDSSSELFFKAGALKYALSARYALDWNIKPFIEIDIEFRNLNVTSFFKLGLNGRNPRITIDAVIVSAVEFKPEPEIHAFRRAIREARLGLRLITNN